MPQPVLIETSTRSITARGLDVSGGGVAVRTDLAWDPAERVGVYFELPIGFAVEVMAEVTRREGDLVVLRFVDAKPEALLAVRSFCRLSGLVPVSRPSPHGGAPRRLRSV